MVNRKGGAKVNLITNQYFMLIIGERISDTITGKKSSWRGDDGAEISVEEVAIQYYSKQGYQG
jgi:hypothetical protein